MGKGIALMFREAFPENTRVYTEAAKAGKVKVGHVLVVANQELLGPKWIINFPTKKHWRQPSKLEWIRSGLRDLVRAIRQHNIVSVAIPPLGCGSGGLDWAQVRKEIEAIAPELAEVDILVYEPTSEYLNAPKREGMEDLTPARALIAELVRRYSVLGIECSNLEVQKLAWFLTRALARSGVPDPLDLRFAANRYGPYADRLRHLLEGLDGSYLHSEKRLSDARPSDAIWFEEGRRDAVARYLASADAGIYVPALEQASEVIDGFQSPLGMELLATVDWLIAEEGVAPEPHAIRTAISQWPGGRSAARRKEALFDDEMIELALRRLSEAGMVGRQPADMRTPSKEQLSS